jgi:hypothetical protein
VLGDCFPREGVKWLDALTLPYQAPQDVQDINMSQNKHKLHNTQLDNLISNLRGEVGEIILTWKLFLRLRRNTRYLYSPDIGNDFQNPDIALLEILTEKLEDEIVSRLSELAEQEIGQLTFYFAQRKLEDKIDLSTDVLNYKKFVEKEGLKDKRNQFISHKQLPETWTDHKDIFISIPTIGKCLSLAVKLMIKIDNIFLGPSAIYLWREVLKKKTPPMRPLNTNFMLLPYMYLDQETRGIIIRKEIKAGLPVWEVVKAKVDGVERDVIICKKWAAILMDQHSFMLCDDYPLQELHEINFDVPKEETEISST